jgi:hypothetical protein
MVTRFYTFEIYTKQSLQSHEHVTLKITANYVYALSQKVHEGATMTRKWDRVGIMWDTTHVRFTEDSIATRMAGTQLKREGWNVEGLRFNDTEFGAIIKLVSDGKRTNPSTIRGYGRNKDAQADKRSRERKGIDMAAAMAARMAR